MTAPVQRVCSRQRGLPRGAAMVTLTCALGYFVMVCISMHCMVSQRLSFYHNQMFSSQAGQQEAGGQQHSAVPICLHATIEGASARSDMH
jgi:hypothetical protein